MTEDRLLLLLKKQADNQISATERRELEEFLATRWVLNQDHHEVDWEELYSSRIKPKRNSRPLRYIWASAAAIILTLGVTFVIHNYQNSAVQESNRQTALILDNIEGAKDGAILTVSSGEEFELEEQQLSEVLERINDYDPVASKTFTITTPKANKYNFTLPDGTQIWLNANSQVTFPEHFSDNERRISTKGEVYLDVTKSQIPFIISTNGIETKVLGTSLNINGYDTDRTFTTLFTGKIALNNGTTSLELTPGQAAVSTADQMQRYEPHLEKTISWKNNLFYFDNEDIKTILSELERWYDVKFDLATGVDSPKRYSGVIDRNLSLNQALEVLSFGTAYKLTISENNIIHVQKIQ